MTLSSGVTTSLTVLLNTGGSDLVSFFFLSTEHRFTFKVSRNDTIMSLQKD